MEVYTSLIVAGLSVSFFHAILPNNWLQFVLAGCAQNGLRVKHCPLSC
jgi:hypothetical protein